MRYRKLRWVLGLMLWLGLLQVGYTQEKTTRVLIVSLFNNATQLPGEGKLGVWGEPVHPGILLGTEFQYSSRPHHEWFQTAKLAYHYHRYVQHSIQLLSEVGYRYHFKGPFDLDSRFGLGYLHAIPATQIFELNHSGLYERKTNWGRPQALASLSLSAGYQLPGGASPRLFVAYQVYFQYPFVNEYVPVLPNSAVHAGVAFPFFHSK